GSNPININELPPSLQAAYFSALNDADGGRYLGFDTLAQLASEVIASVGMPQMSVDAQGNITVIWYDARRDPTDHNLDVYGTTSTDGGVTFSANYRITTQNFDPNVGAPTDGAGHPYIGDRIGLASANGNVYAAWTDSLTGSQNIYFAHYSLAPAPVP